jgi:serine O-acetyltransferase
MARPTIRSLFDQLRREYEIHDRSLLAPELWVMATYRFGRWAQELPPPAARVCSKVYGLLTLANLLATGCLLNREAELGEGFHLVHIGNVKIHPGVKIGRNVGVMHDVTIGTNMKEGAPQIGNGVFIGAGAKLLGTIQVGDDARIASNSLVISDVPAGTTAIGVPARILRYTGRPVPNPETGNSGN